MKKAAVFFLAILHVAITSGVVVNVHYCMGHIASVKYGAEKEGLCEKCGMAQKKECCHTEHKLVKAAQSHMAADQPFVLHHPEFASTATHYPSSRAFYRNQSHFYTKYHSPPDQRMSSLRLYDRVFRI